MERSVKIGNLLMYINALIPGRSFIMIFVVVCPKTT